MPIINSNKITSLYIGCADNEKFNFELLLPKLHSLTVLSISFSKLLDPFLVSSILNVCCKQIHTYEIDGCIDDDNVQYFERMIDLMKPNLIQRSSRLTLKLISQSSFSIADAIQINQILEKDKSLEQKLRLELKWIIPRPEQYDQTIKLINSE